MNDLRNKAVLITGGTMGIGLAAGLEFGRQGARCILTCKWGSADEGEILDRFREEGLPAPLIVQADVASPDDTSELLSRIKQDHAAVEVFVSNVAFAHLVPGMTDIEGYSLRALSKSIEYTAWPMFEYTRQIHRVFGKYPRYVLGLSSGGVHHVYQNYDFVAASKAVMETLSRYMNARLADEGVNVNIVRAHYVETESLWATFGKDFRDFVKKMSPVRQFTTTEEVAKTLVALCSGLMDGVRGQVLDLDRGSTFSVNLMGLHDLHARSNQ